ncbi:MAG TPA: helix-turn-helix domain-containing protein [Blastocatellia bacterium]|nr:helix-turn-helix domain-containing protein [Blastocatellia bacterium]
MSAAVQVLQSAASAEKLLKPERLRMLELLTEADSATGLARRLNMPRQTVNYHLRQLEKEGFVELVEERLKGNCLERFVRAAARSYVISPLALGALGEEPGAARDKFSAAYLVSAAARAIRDVSILRSRADKAGKKLATLTLETEVRFSDAKARQEFTEELVNTVARLAIKYHQEDAKDGRSFRFLVGAYPAITKQEPVDQTSVKLE